MGRCTVHRPLRDLRVRVLLAPGVRNHNTGYIALDRVALGSRGRALGRARGESAGAVRAEALEQAGHAAHLGERLERLGVDERGEVEGLVCKGAGIDVLVLREVELAARFGALTLLRRLALLGRVILAAFLLVRGAGTAIMTLGLHERRG